MNIEQIREYCLSKQHTAESFPFDQDTLVFKVMNKMFALLSLKNFEKEEGAINLKCDPERAVVLREQYLSIRPGYHMSKSHWNTVELFHNEISPEMLKELIDHSYDLIVASLPKKDRHFFN